MNTIGIAAFPPDMQPRLHAAITLINRAETALMDIAELTLAELSVLRVVVAEYEASRGISPRMSDLAYRLSCQKSNMTQLIDRMQRKGLVQRKTHRFEQRVFRVLSTDEGRQRLDKAETNHDWWYGVGKKATVTP